MFKILIGIIILWNFILIKKNNKKKSKKYSKNIEKFILGNSHTYYSFQEEKNSRIINFSEISQTLYYDLKILKKNTKYIKKSKVCYINLSYFSFNSSKLWQKSDIVKYYWLLNLKDFQYKDKIKYIYYKYFPILISLYKKIKKNKKIKKQINTEKRLKKHVEILNNKENIEFNLKLLCSIIDICLENKIKVILITTPFSEKYNSVFSKEILFENFYKYVFQIKKKYKIEYLDFSRDKSFFRDEYFTDLDHLSSQGSKVFLEKIKL